MVNTIAQYEEQTGKAFDLFIKKFIDYGTSWRILRPISVTDQIWIKAKRIRTIQELGAQKVTDSIASEFIGILNYSILGVIQISPENDTLPFDVPDEKMRELYHAEIKKSKS